MTGGGIDMGLTSMRVTASYSYEGLVAAAITYSLKSKLVTKKTKCLREHS